jgi:hypothetical protein
MDLERKKALLFSSLERAADKLGDITPHTMALFYHRYPQAMALFEELYPGARLSLEGEMVQQILFCLMEWYDSASEIEIILTTTVPHHIETLKVRPELFQDLINAVCDTIVATIPTSKHDEQAVWAELRGVMTALVDQEMVFVEQQNQRRKVIQT